MKRKATATLIFFAASLAAIWLIVFLSPAFRLLIALAGMPLFGTGYSATISKSEIPTVSNHSRLIIISSDKPPEVNEPVYLIIHGMTHEGIEHSDLLRSALALARSTGRTIFIPEFSNLKQFNISAKSLLEIVSIIRQLQIRDDFGEYIIIGTCVGGPLAITAVERESMDKPQKILLFSAANSLEGLLDFYNQDATKAHPDFYGKSILYLNFYASDIERKTILNFLNSTQSGDTHPHEAQAKLGLELYRHILRFRFNKEAILNELGDSFDLTEHFYPAKKSYELYLIHDTEDRFIPFTESLKIYEKFTKSGGRANLYISGTGKHGNVPETWKSSLLDFVSKFLE